MNTRIHASRVAFATLSCLASASVAALAACDEYKPRGDSQAAASTSAGQSAGGGGSSSESGAAGLEVGMRFPPFEATDTAGKPVKFPGDYKGKIVLLDFWATWCGPCMSEMPHVVEASKRYGSRGFTVLGISLDNRQTLSRMPSVMERAGMTWPQIADGGGWSAELAQKYRIDSIPMCYLVDGNNGKILGKELRGEELRSAVVRALPKE